MTGNANVLIYSWKYEKCLFGTQMSYLLIANSISDNHRWRCQFRILNGRNLDQNRLKGKLENFKSNSENFNDKKTFEEKLLMVSDHKSNY